MQDVDLTALQPLNVSGSVCKLGGDETRQSAPNVPPFCRELDSVQWNAEGVFAAVVAAPEGVPFGDKAPLPAAQRAHAVDAMLQVRTPPHLYHIGYI